MIRYFTALNIKDTVAYRSINARLLYLHMCCSMDYSTRVFVCSGRALASELGMTYKAVRCAIDTLLAANLIRAQEGAQSRAQPTVYYINDLQGIEGASEVASEGTPINNNNNKFSLTSARERFTKKEKINRVAEYLECEPFDAENWVLMFFAIQELRQRSEWLDEIDAWQHMLSWIDIKRNSRRRAAPSAARAAEEPRVAEEPREEEECPPGWSLKDWKNLVHLVGTPNHHPAVDEAYNEALKAWKEEKKKEN